MKRWNRFLSVFLALVLLVTSVPFDVKAAESETKILVESKNVTLGEEVSVDVLIQNNPGIFGATLEFSFDEGLSLINAKAGDAFAHLAMTKPGKFSSPCRFVWDGQDFSEEDIKDGVILTLTFEVEEGAAVGTPLMIAVTIPNGDIYDSELNPIEVTAEAGSVTVRDFVPGDVNGDENVNVSDIILVRRYLVGGYDVTLNENAANVNGDKVVSSADIVLLRRYVAGGYGVELYPPSELICKHKMEAAEYMAPTCTEDGIVAHWYCMSCQKYYGDEQGNLEIKKEETVILAKGHTVVIDPAIEPTYTQTGLTEGSHCSACGEVLKAQEIIPMLEKTEYSVTYHISNSDTYLAGLNIENPNPDNYTKEEGLELEDLVVDGYLFKGWYTSATGGTKVTEIAKGSTGKKTLYAQWEKVEYIVTFDSPDVPVASIKYTVDRGITLTSPTWFGYTFVGWSIDGKIITSILPGTTGNITLHANWTSNRNRARAVEKIEDPIVIEDMDSGRYLFIYEMGTIENVPIAPIEYIGNTETLTINNEYSYSKTVNENYIKTVANTISNATTKSSAMTLSSEWNSSTSATNSHEEQKGKTEARTDSEGNVIASQYYVSNSKGGSTSSSSSAGGSSSTSSKVTLDESVGINGSYAKSREESDSVALGVGATVDADFNWNIGGNLGWSKGSSLNAGLGITDGIASLGLSAGVTKGFSAGLTGGIGGSVGGSATGNYSEEEITKDSISGTIAGARTENVGAEFANSSEANWDVSNTASSTWNTTDGYESSKSTSTNTELSKTISEVINDTYSYTSMESRSEGHSATTSTGESSELTDEYTSTVEYSVEEQTTETKKITYTSSVPGYYRLVLAGTVHVFAVVGYDIATNSYFTYTYNVLDKERHTYLDYSKDNANFNDCENAILSIEIPYFVHEFVHGSIAKSKGLTIDYDTGVITEYTGDSEYVVVPEYVSVNNGDGTYSAIRVRGFSEDAFRGNTTIKGVVLPKYVYEIPDGAFAGCTSLEHVSGYAITEIGENAFKDCISLNRFNVDEYVESLGNYAFENVPEIMVTAANESVADAALSSGAKRITLNLAKLKEGEVFDERKISISEEIEYFALISDGSSYNNLQIDSKATETVVNNIIFTNNLDTPLKLNSEKVTLNRVIIEKAPGFAIILSSANTELALYGNVRVSTNGANAMISKSVVLCKANSEVAGKLNIIGDYLVCGQLTNDKMLTFEKGEVVYIDEKEFENMLTSCMLTFDANGGTVTETSKQVYYGQSYGTLPTPDRQYYTFQGWYTAATGGTKITENSIVNVLANQTLYAQWKANTYTLKFNANGGSVSETSRTATCGQAVGTLPTPTRQYHTFQGWYTAATGGTKVTFTSEFSSDTTLYAQWKVNTYTLTFNANGGSVSEKSRTATCGQAIETLPTPTRDYHKFEGWYTAATGGTKVTNTTAFNAATTIYAHWTPGDVSGWVKASEMPAGAQIVNTKWTYTLREYKESSSSSMSGYTKYDTKRTSWGGTQGPVYSDPSNGARNVWSEQYETGRTHHWVYYRWQNPANDYGSDVQSNSYKNYQEIDLTYQLTETGTMGVHSRGYKYWQGSSYDTYWPSREYDDVHYGTRWYYQEPVYTYYFYRDVNKEATSDPTGQANVSNVVKYVQYRAK